MFTHPNTSRTATPTVEIYSEDPGEDHEIVEGDIDEFAERIGIDVKNEQYLLYIAEEGLKKIVPQPWKICFDPNKKSWFYYNKETRQSQWVHPLNEVYKEKVIKARMNLAISRIQTFDVSKSRPPKSLPPLKKGPRPSSSGLNRLGPIGSFVPNASQASQLPNERQRMDLTPSASLGELNLSNKSSSNHLSINDNLQNPSSRTVKKPLGLTLTGDGANFLKGSLKKPNPSGITNTSSTKATVAANMTNTETSTVFGETVDEQQQKELKSILSSNNSTETQKDNSLDPWNVKLDELTANEAQLVNNLGDGTKKLGVKFALDENTTLKFDVSSDENDASEDHRKSPKSDATSEDESTDEEEESKDSLSAKIKSKSAFVTSSKSTPSFEAVAANEKNIGAGEKKSSHSNLSEAAAEASKETMRLTMEENLKKYEEELDKERIEREGQIRKHMDASLQVLRSEKDQEIKKAKQNFEQKKNVELNNVKREFESLIQGEVKKLKAHFDQELVEKKSEIRELHEKTMKTLIHDSESANDESKLVMKQSHSEEVSGLQNELKQQKMLLKDEQKRQIQQIKDYHKSFIDKLKDELEAEKLKLQKEHQERIAEIKNSYEQESQKMESRFRKDQETSLNLLVDEFEKEKASVESQLKDGITNLKNDMQSLKLTHDLNQNEAEESKSTPRNPDNDELKDLTNKYNTLEKKYKFIKRELKKLGGGKTILTQRTASAKRVSSQESTFPESDQDNTPVPKPRHKAVENVIGRSQQSANNGSDSPSQSDSSFYPSSSVNRLPEDPNSEDEEDTKLFVVTEHNSDKLACALQSLEVIKAQILKIKDGQTQESPSSGGKNFRNLVKNSPRSLKESTPSGNNISARSSRRRPVPTSSTPNKSSARNNTNPSQTPNCHPHSRNAKELPQVDEAPEDSSTEIVKEAKEFIRSQQERFNLKLENPISSTRNRPRYEVEESGYSNGSMPLNHSPKSDFHSETESSGVGSLKDLNSLEKKKISKDIQSICSSLSNLDEQMRLMWTVVQGAPPNNSVQFGSGLASSRALSSSAMLSSSLGNLNIPNQLPSTGYSVKDGKPSRYARPVTAYDLSSLIQTGHQPGSGSRALVEALKANNLPSSRMSASNLLSSLDNELKQFKAAKEKIMSQFTVGEGSSGRRNTGPSDNLQEKTKDLREWLEKF